MNKDEMNEAAHKWVFETNGHKWSNNNDECGDNYGSFIEGYNQAAAACSTLADEFAVGFADFRQIKCARYGKEWLHNGKVYTTQQLLELYKSQNHGK